jgi:ADP-ribose pyrophosphatase
VGVLPLLDDGRVCLIQSRRLTVDRTLIEIPAGTREPDEPPLETARRELAEETGYRAARLEELAAYYPSPGIMDERLWLYVATGLTEGEHAREANEEIENYVVPWEQALAMVESGEIEDGKSMLAILLWAGRRSKRLLQGGSIE